MGNDLQRMIPVHGDGKYCHQPKFRVSGGMPNGQVKGPKGERYCICCDNVLQQIDKETFQCPVCPPKKLVEVPATPSKIKKFFKALVRL